MAKEKNELKSLPLEKLKLKIDEFRHELFKLRLNAATAHIKDYSQFKKLRRDIARAITFLQQKKTQENVGKGT